jgi:lipopolysaccharide/colanic/teichoic acid biosynthesis glycosyltransferase/glycosyltransferase involved in cell wall biosynthesis
MKGRENSNEQSPVRVVHMVTSSLSVRFLEGQPKYLGKKKYEVVVVSSAGEELRKAEREGIRTVAVEMEREISPWKDVISLGRLVRVIRRLRPAITNVATPKAGLLGGVAAWLCGVPCRYYTLLGLRCETTSGLKRKLLVLSERIACQCAHRVICVSESLRRKAIELGIVDAEHTVVFASGSFVGTDAKRFTPTADALQRAAQIRQELGIPPEALVIGFIGRLTKDKGISELVEAYLELRINIPELRLLLVGEMEAGDPLPPATRRCLESEHGILRTGFVEDPADYYHVMDVFAFPTYREGFGNVALEAHAAGKPVVATAATGVRDAVIDGVTGMLVPVGDGRALARALEVVLKDRRLAAELGSAGRERVLCEFQPEIVWDAMAEEYARGLREKSRSLTAQTLLGMTDGGVGTGARRRHGAKLFVKRAMDIAVGGVGLIVAAPLMAMVAAAVWVRDGGPVLFRQRRPGYKGELFVLLKFRTMREARDEEGRLLADGERLTALGRLLRQLSLDELPQLWNVLGGEMSLVGPRPLLMEYLERYSQEEMRRHEVKPGITGWAQIHGRNATSWRERFALDVWYVEHWSLLLDLKIMFATVWELIAQRGISFDGHATMPEFRGRGDRKIYGWNE